MPTIAVLRGTTKKHHKKAHKSHKKHAHKAAAPKTDKAHTKQALAFKKKLYDCADGRPKTSSVTLKEYYACMRK